jgi:AcrR family transcriptional regulator
VPKYVDHDERRREVAAVAAQIVAAEGRRALTVRRVAEMAGHSTTVVSHYFDDMSELLHATYSLAADRSRARVDAVLKADPTDIVGLAEAILPLDAARREDWRIWLAFWGEAFGSPELADEQRQRARNSSDRFHRCLQLLADDGRLGPGTDPRSLADRINALIQGIAAEATFDPRKWTARAQRDTIRSTLRDLGVRLEPAKYTA